MKAGISGSSREELAAVTARGRRLVTVDDVANELSLERAVAAKKLARWAEQGWLRRVRRGLYIPVPIDVEHPELWSEDALVLADAVWSPCYFTGWTAANRWGLTEQIFRTIVVKTTGRVRATSQELLDQDYLVGHVPKSAMAWGMRSAWQQERRIRFADEARTIVDVLHEPRIGGGIRHVAEMLETYLFDSDWRQIVEYGDLLGTSTVFKRLGYLSETLQLGDQELLAECEQRLSSGVSLLDPGVPHTGPRVGRWGLRANVRVEESDGS